MTGTIFKPFLLFCSLILLSSSFAKADLSLEAGGVTPEMMPAADTGGEKAIDIGPSISDAFSKLVCSAEKSIPQELIEGDVQTLGNLMSTYNNPHACVTKSFSSKYIHGFKKYAENYSKCVQREHNAKLWCLEGCSPDIKEAVATANMIVPMVRQSGIVDACGKMDKLMKVMETGFSAFGLNCGTRKGLCSSACSAAAEGLQEMKEALSVGFNDAEIAHCGLVDSHEKTWALNKYKAFAGPSKAIIEKDIAEGQRLNTVGRVKTCAGYKEQLVAAGLNVLSAIAAGKQANNCEQITSGIDTRTECEKPENQETPKCICEKNPRLPGCPMYEDDSRYSHDNQFQSDDPSANFNRPLDPGGTIPIGDHPDLATKPTNDSTGSKASGSAPTSGGSSAGGLEGSGSGSSQANEAGETIKKLKTNVYSGEGGGGGSWGSYGGGSYGDSSSSAGGANARRAYALTKAEREIASLRSQVTSPGGKSNWEKVRSRYSAEKSKLLGQ